MDRREFLRTGGMLSAGAACAYGLPLLPASISSTKSTEESSGKYKWGMVIDLNKCNECPPECDACMKACREEKNVALHGDKRWDVYLIRKVKIKREHPVHSAEKCVPLLCNHCDDPPCAQACPVQATYKRDDGIVIVDHHRCIGCRYCMIACPYNARHFNFKEGHDWPNKNQTRSAHGVPESCNFCAHLDLVGGEMPKCVQACEKKALVFGNLQDPDSDVAKLIAGEPVRGIQEGPARALREDFGTKPKVFYIGL